MSSTPEYDEYKARFDNRYPVKARQDPRGVIATKIDRIKELRNKLLGINVTPENRQEVNDDLFAISMLSKTLRTNYNSAKNEDAKQIYENASIYRISIWGGGAGEFKSRILDKSPEALTQALAPDNPIVNKKFTDMTYVSTSTVVESDEFLKLMEEEEKAREEEEEKEDILKAPKNIVEGDEGVVRVKTEVEIPPTIDEDAVYISEDIKKLAEDIYATQKSRTSEDPLEVLEVPAGAPESRREEEPAEPPPLPTATEDATPTPAETTPPPAETTTVPPTGADTPPATPPDTPPQATRTIPTIPSTAPTQEFEVEAGTRTQPTLEGVLGGIDRGVLSSISTSRREGLSINKLKEDIKDFHKIYNNVIPAFRDKSHQQRKEKALKSKNKREVLQHYEEMENLIANYYKNDGGFKLGVIVSAESLFSGNVFGGSDLFGTGMVGANTGITPIDRNSLERGGTTKYEKVVDIEPTYTRGGIDHALQKPVQNKEPKVKKGRVRFDKNISTIPVAVHRPYNHILNRPLKPSYNIKIKGKK